MVTSVQMVPIAPKSKREKENQEGYVSKAEGKKSVFGEVLDEFMEEKPSFEFKNSTYGPNSLMSTFLYMRHAYN